MTPPLKRHRHSAVGVIHGGNAKYDWEMSSARICLLLTKGIISPFLPSLTFDLLPPTLTSRLFPPSDQTQHTQLAAMPFLPPRDWTSTDQLVLFTFGFVLRQTLMYHFELDPRWCNSKQTLAHICICALLLLPVWLYVRWGWRIASRVVRGSGSAVRVGICGQEQVR